MHSLFRQRENGERLSGYDDDFGRDGTDSGGMNRRLSAKNIKIARPTFFGYVATRDEFEGYANELFKMMTEDKFNVKIHEVYPLQDVARAHNVSHAWVIYAMKSVLTSATGSGRPENNWQTAAKALVRSISRTYMNSEHACARCDPCDQTDHPSITISSPCSYPSPAAPSALVALDASSSSSSVVPSGLVTT